MKIQELLKEKNNLLLFGSVYEKFLKIILKIR